MSADNWRVCPKCGSDDLEDRTKAIRAANALYGKVPAANFILALDRARKLPDNDPKLTMREDYEIGIYEDGEFSISYRCSCQKCQFSWKFNYTELVVKP